jgi:glycosyltransferase involved in cell wall biosynthesis
MNDKKKILYPLRINSPAPIPTIHRNIGTHLQNEFDFIALYGSKFGDIENFSPFTLKIDNRWTRIRRLKKILDLYSTEFDLIHTGMSGFKSHPYLISLSSLRGVRHIHTHHSATPEHYKKQKILSENADIVTSVSEFVSGWVNREFETPEVQIIPNGVDIQQYSQNLDSTERNHILYVGRLVEQKHPELIIDIAERCDKWKFFICGEGPLLERLKSAAPSNVSFLGYLSSEELAKKYARCAVTLCPYENEGFGMVVLESMAAGSPVVGFDSGSLSSLITPQSGTLCSSLNPQEWLDAIAYVRENHDEFSPRSRAMDFQWPKIAQQYRNVYYQLINSNNE